MFHYIDQRSVQNQKSEQDLTELLAYEILQEIDQSIINDINDFLVLGHNFKKNKYRSIDDDWEISAFDGH